MAAGEHRPAKPGGAFEAPMEVPSEVSKARASFDYGCAIAIAETAEKAAVRIENRLNLCRSSYFEMGRELLWAKDQLGSANFLRWIENKFGLTSRVAENYMALARELGDLAETVSYLPASTLFDLARHSTPQRVRNEIRARWSRNECPSSGDIETRIRYGRQNEKFALEARKQARNRKRRLAYARKRG